MKTVVVGISSGIAAYKLLDLIKTLQSTDITVEVIMTQSATKMLAIEEVEKLIQKPVHTELYPKDFNYKTILENRTVDHIALADAANVFIVAPATANTIAKLAHGIADDFLTTTALAVTAPFIICPSMNVNMWNNPVVQENIATLRKMGAIIVEPEEGPLACGYEGKGRLASTTTMVDEIHKQLERSAWFEGKTVVVTAGGTSEQIDAARTITNKSTGKMGVAIAEECYLSGAKVILLHAHSVLSPRYLVEKHAFTSSEELKELLQKYTPQADYIFHTAAVSDFTPEATNEKLDSDNKQVIQLKPQPKLLPLLRDWNLKAFIVGFKAEAKNNIEKPTQVAQQKLEATSVDMIVANDISKADRGFAADTNEVVIVQKTKDVVFIPLASKKEVAKEIVKQIGKAIS